MRTEQLTIRELFEPAIRYVMPETQREYVWTQRRQWEPLWDDVRDTAEAHLRNRHVIPSSPVRQPFHRTAHFLGPVVLQVETGTLAGNVYTKTVIDGQQRLTTLQLLLSAAKSVTSEYHASTSETLKTYIFNTERSWPENNPKYRYKIWSRASETDRASMTSVVDLAAGEVNGIHQIPPPEGPTHSLIIDAFEYFKNRITDWLTNADQTNLPEYCEALQHTLLGLLTVITIEVRPEDDPQLIYETLNARGTSLLQSELIKNRLLAQAGTEDTEWPFNADDWWRSKPEDDWQNRDQADIFLHHWVTMKVRNIVLSQDVYEVYSRFANASSRSPKAILEDITQTAEEYKYRERTQDPLYAFLKSMTVPEIIPIVLWLLINEKNNNQQYKALLALSSFVARRRISGKATTGEPMKIIIGGMFRRVFTTRNIGNSGDRLVEHLRDFSREAPTEWPDDERLENHFRQQPLYITAGPDTVRALLRGLETRLRIEANRAQLDKSKALPLNPPDSVSSVEHIMPKAWSEYWPTVIDDKNRRDAMVNSIGNLTLVTTPLNSELANKAWTDKRRLISQDRDCNQMLLNKTLFMSEYSRWDEEAIAKRSRTLFETALKVWLSPNSTEWN